MAGEQEPGKSGALETLVSGGLPQLALGPIGAALNRLFGNSVDIPAAKIEQVVQGIKDQTAANSEVSRAIAVAVGEEAAKDPTIIQRGLETMVAKALRSQINTDAVGTKTREYLKIEPPPLDSRGPSEDWMNVFSEHVGRASSEEVRDLYAMLCAGEIRRPGAVSLRTLSVMSVLDAETALQFQEICRFAWDNHFIPRAGVDGKVKYRTLIDLEDAGLLELGGGSLVIDLIPEGDERTNLTMKGGNVALLVEFDGDVRGSMGIYVLTRAGADLCKLLKVDSNPEVIAKALLADTVPFKTLSVGTPVATGRDTYRIEGLQTLPIDRPAM